MAFEIVIPRLGWSMDEGTFAGWLKQDGDYIHRGDPLFELEGEKAVQEIEALDEGTLRIPPNGPEPGQVLKVGVVVAYLVGHGEPIPDAPTGAFSEAAESTNESLAHQAPTLPPAASPSTRRLARQLNVDLKNVDGTGRDGRIVPGDVERAAAEESSNLKDTVISSATVASPRARRVAAELGIDWTALTGTGAGGRIRERDVRAAAAAITHRVGDGQPVLHSSVQRIAVPNRRRVIAQRMIISQQQTVPVTLTTKAIATNLVNLREQFKSTANSGLIPSYQDIITKLVAEAILLHPMLAARWDEDHIILPSLNEIHLGMAVDTDDGLLVPVLRNAGSLTLNQLAEQSRLLIESARSGKLTTAQMQSAVFTITNLGAFGIDAFTPVINFPESAILGLGAIRREPVCGEDGQITPQHQLALSLTFDHRVIDGAPAARFLQTLASAIANPSAWLLIR